MKKTILFFLLAFNFLNAFEIRTWYLGNIDNTNYELKSTNLLSEYFSEDFDIACVQGISSELALKSISGDKQYFSTINSNLAFLVKNAYKNIDVTLYNDIENVYLNKPQILYVKDINLVLINYLASTDSIQREKELKNIDKVFNFAKNDYFEKTNKAIELDRIIMCGNFRETFGFVKNNISNLFYVSNNMGTLIDQNFGVSNYDYDHFISIHYFNPTPDERIFKIDTKYKKIIDQISPHLPLILKL